MSKPGPPTSLRSAWLSSIRTLARYTGVENFRLLAQCLAELWGTALIVIFGVGMVNSAVFAESAVGIWQVAVIWAIGVALAIYTTASISGAHLNPAVSLAFALVRPEDFPLYKLPFYSLAQLLGGMLGGAINLGVYGSLIDNFERKMNIDRGDRNSVLSALAFGEYFPNPGFTEQPFQEEGSSDFVFASNGVVTPGGALAVKAWGTFLLCFVVFALTHPKTTLFGPQAHRPLVPAIIGSLIGVLLSLYAPITQAGWNPARDFGPRLIAWFAGWGRIAIPGPRDGFWVYIVGPLIGGPLGAIFHDFVLACGLHCESILESEEKKQDDRGDYDLDSHQPKGKGEGCGESPMQRPAVVSSLRVISSAELTAGKLSKYADNIVGASTASKDTSETIGPGVEHTQGAKALHLCQFFQISSSDLEPTGRDHGKDEDSPKGSTSEGFADKMLTPIAEVECAIGSCSIPNKIIAMTSTSSSVPKEEDNKAKDPETREPSTSNSFLVLHVSVS